MKRRNFIKSGSILSLPIMLGSTEVAAITNSKICNLVNGDTDRVLVLIQLDGGNDGLNTLIPLDQYSNLVQLRSNIIIPEQSIIPLTDTNGFHPSLNGFKSIWDDGNLGIVQNVAYPNQNRSHFRSTDIWTTASPADEVYTSGWMGRYLESKYPEYPQDFPNSDCPDPFAITLGYVVSETCQGTSSNYSIAITDPSELGQLEETEDGELDTTCYGQELGFIRDTIRQTNAYSTSVGEAWDNGNNIGEYSDTNRLAQQLKVVARLIAGGLQTKIYVVSLGGFDTHADQVENNSPLQGDHALLLETLSEAVLNFQTDIKQLGVDERVLGLTYSEFGRRIRSNFSLGTDHGTAAPMFLFGSCVNSVILGDNPEIDTNVDFQEGVAMQFDFRSIYGSVLMDWFDAEESEVKALLYEDFNHIPIIESCRIISDVDDKNLSIDINIYPNPCENYLHLEFESDGSDMRISIFDVLGSELRVISDQKLLIGKEKISIPVHDLIAGNYFVRLQSGNKVKTKKFVKV